METYDTPSRRYHLRLHDSTASKVKAIADHHGVSLSVVVDAVLSHVDHNLASDAVARVVGQSPKFPFGGRRA